MARTKTKIWFVADGMMAAVWSWPGTVIAVHDDAVITVKRENGKMERIRLFGVDLPEHAHTGRWTAQPYSRLPISFIRSILKRERRAEVTIWEIGEDCSGAMYGVILYNGRTVQEELLQNGLAWVIPRHCKQTICKCRGWTELQRKAAKSRRGLWRDLDGRCRPVAPWIWRSKEK